MGEYSVKKYSEGFWQICDCKNNAAYLIEGDSRALLIDTMMSDTPLLPLIRTLSDKPLLLALTHAHIDHMYRCEEFDTVYLHEKDIKDWKQGLGLIMWLGTPLFKVKHKKFKVDTFVPLYDDSEINLGGFSVKCLRVSGHTKGSLLFADVRHKAIICGDAVGSGSGVWMFLPFCSDINTYKSSLEAALKKLKPYENYSYYGGHREEENAENSTPLSFKSFADMRLLCKKILDGTAELKVIKKIPTVPLLFAKEGAAAILTRKKKIGKIKIGD